MHKSREIIENIILSKSVSIVGLGKNTGKTAVLNYLLNLSRKFDYKPAITSIGLDGEDVDQVTGTEKPEIVVSKNHIFATSERFFSKKTFTTEILDVTDYGSPLGKTVIGKALGPGKVILAGPSTASGIKCVIKKFQTFGPDFVLIDGAISRLSPSSPFVTGGVILATGAAFSLNKIELLRQTRHIVELMNLPKIDDNIAKEIHEFGTGVWARQSGEWKLLPVKTSLNIDGEIISSMLAGDLIYINGAVTDRLLKRIMQSHKLSDFTLLTGDYTRIFARPETIKDFSRWGGKIRVIKKAKLIAVTFNPVSPSGYMLDSRELTTLLNEQLNIPVIDVFEEEQI